jgi:CRISPR-associated endoribonuclease Cas6
MVLDLFFHLKNAELPKDYRPVFVSFLKSALSRHYPLAYEQMYGKSAIQKSFTFSIALPGPKFESDLIFLIKNELLLSLSTDEESDTLIFYNAFQKSMRASFPLINDNEMIPVKMNIRPSVKIKDSQTIIKFLSPLVVRKHIKSENDQYYIFGEEWFDECLEEVVSRRIGRKISIKLEPISPKKTVVRSFGTNIRCSLGIYKLKGEPEILTMLQNGGIGSRRNEGFGMFSVIGGADDR